MVQCLVVGCGQQVTLLVLAAVLVLELVVGTLVPVLVPVTGSLVPPGLICGL